MASEVEVKSTVGSQFQPVRLTESGYIYVSSCGYFETKEEALSKAQALRAKGYEPWIEYNADLEKYFTAWTVCLASEYRV